MKSNKTLQREKREAAKKTSSNTSPSKAHGNHNVEMRDVNEKQDHSEERKD